MESNRTPLISPTQVYLNSDLNEYLVVTNVVKGQVSYQGSGFLGQADSFSFIEEFCPVDPTDLSDAEIDALLKYVPFTESLTIGYIGGN